MQLNNPAKLIVALVLSICMTILMLAGVTSSEAGVPFLTAIGGYVLGNGIAARKGDPVEPILRSRSNGGK
jgi:hypothetical protein